MVLNGALSDSDSVLSQNSEDSLNNSYEYQYVMFIKNIFDRKLFPEDFNVWSIHEQYTWINKNLQKFYPNVPQSLLSYIPATFRQPDFDRSPVEVPEWLDMEKYSRGQKFAHENYVALLLSTLIGVMYSFSFDDALKTLIIAKQSVTPYSEFKRYLSTIQRIFNWYNGLPWIKETTAYKNMQYVCKMHLMIRKKLCKLDNEQIYNAKIAKPWCPDRELLVKDFTTTCPLEKFGQRFYILNRDSPYKPKNINNSDMAGTPCSIMGLIVLYPEHFGIHNAIDEDLEAFCHMWRCYGYFLGIADEYNFCRGSLDEIKQRVQDWYRYWIIPNLKDITSEWEHMTRCMIESVNYYTLYMPYKTLMLFATDILNLNMPHLYASLSYPEWIAYKSLTFTMHYAMRFLSVRVIFNKLFYKMIDKATNFTSEKHEELQKMSNEQVSNLSIIYQRKA